MTRARDAAYAKRTEKVLASTQLWEVESVTGRARLAERLNQIVAAGAIISQVLGGGGEYEIVWYHWEP